MPIITLTTDWGNRDYFSGALKGLLHSSSPGIEIVDISHQVTPNSVQEAAYILKNCYQKFPKKTLHFIGVNQYQTVPTELLAIEYEGQHFIGMNNGVFSMVFDSLPSNIVVVDQIESADPGFDMETIAATAAHLLSGNKLSDLGKSPKEFVVKRVFTPALEEQFLKGIVIYIDHFGNVVTNIDKELFESQLRGRKFEIYMRKHDVHSVDSISTQYYDKPDGEVLALFNSSGLLEIAINQANASKLLGLKLSDYIRIEFK
jgi:S-adenosylmethionine hydrolase